MSLNNITRWDFTKLHIMIKRCYHHIWRNHSWTGHIMVINATFVQCMMTSWNGNFFPVTGHLCGEFTGPFPAQRPVTRGFDNFFDLRLNKRLRKQSWGWWFETPSGLLWRHHNGKSANEKYIHMRIFFTLIWCKKSYFAGIQEVLRKNKRGC